MASPAKATSCPASLRVEMRSTPRSADRAIVTNGFVATTKATCVAGRYVSEALKLHGKIAKKSTPSRATCMRSRLGIAGKARRPATAITHPQAIA